MLAVGVVQCLEGNSKSNHSSSISYSTNTVLHISHISIEFAWFCYICLHCLFWYYSVILCISYIFTQKHLWHTLLHYVFVCNIFLISFVLEYCSLYQHIWFRDVLGHPRYSHVAACYGDLEAIHSRSSQRVLCRKRNAHLAARWSNNWTRAGQSTKVDEPTKASTGFYGPYLR